MRIIFLNFYGGKVARGIETYVHELGNRLAGSHEVTVFQCGPRVSKSNYETVTINVGVDWRKLNELRHLSTLLFFDFNLSNLLRRFYLDYWSRAQGHFAWQSISQLSHQTDIVVTAGSGWVSLLSRLWCWRYRAKLIIAGQSGPGWDDRVNLLCRPDVFVALTNYQAQWARRNAFGVKVTKIPNGVDLEKFNPQVKSAKVALLRPLFLCVAALEPGKRVEWTIKAVAKLQKGSLLVMGAGPLEEDLTELAAKLLPGRFQIVSVPHAQIPAYYAAASVVTMVPPLTESFGIVFLEAMAENRPVVTSDDPARREIVGPAGLFVNSGDINRYSQALRKVLAKKWGNIPRRQAEKFSWGRVAEQYEKLFRSVR